MRPIFHAAAAIVGAFVVCASSYDASATTVGISSQDIVNLPPIGSIVDPTPAPGPFTFGSVLTGLTGPSVGGRYRSPFEDYSFPNTIPPGYLSVPYTSIGSFGPGSAAYNFNSPQTTLVALWGSPDSYNILTFYNGLNGTGAPEGTFIGNDLLIQGNGHDLVTFLATGGTFLSVVLSSNQAAFEFAGVDSQTPLPAALPLFATGLGVIGYFSAWRRKKSMAHAPVAA
jgi:hypothetical protein